MLPICVPKSFGLNPGRGKSKSPFGETVCTNAEPVVSRQATQKLPLASISLS